MPDEPKKCKQCGAEWILDPESQLCGPCLMRQKPNEFSAKAYTIDGKKALFVSTAIISMFAAAGLSCGETHYILKTLYHGHMQAHGIAGDQDITDNKDYKNMTDEQIQAMFGGHSPDPSKKPN